MQINQKLSEEIYEDAGKERMEKATQYVRQGEVDIEKVEYEDKNNFNIRAEVKGHYDKYEVSIKVKRGELEDVSCECQDYLQRYGVCKHIVAALMKFEQTKFWDKSDEYSKGKKSFNTKYRNFSRIVNEFYNEELQEINLEEVENLTEKEKVKLEPKIVYDRYDGKLKVEFKIGNKRMYKIKDLAEFYTRMITNEYYKYGEKLEFLHKRENFTEDSQKILDFALRYAEMLKYAENDRYSYYGNTLNRSSIVLGASTLDEIFDILKNKDIYIDRERTTELLELKEEDPNIEFELSREAKNDYVISPNVNLYEIVVLKGKEHTYVLQENVLYRCTQEFVNTTIKLIRVFREIYTTEINLRQEDLGDLYSIIMPRVGNSIKLKDVSEEEIELYKPKTLETKIYLDYDKNDYIIADVKFCYDGEEFNPLDEKTKVTSVRNMIQENRNLNILRKTGFMVDMKNLRFILPDNDKIYNFLSNDIELYMQKFEVLVTDNFKTKEIKKPKLGSIGVKVENNLLSIDLSKLNIDLIELQDIMKKYKLKKKYHKLRDGNFLNLDENEDIEFLDKLVTGLGLEYKDLEKDTIKLPVNRSLYLNELLKNRKVSKNNEFKEIVENLEVQNIDEEVNIPASMEGVLRDYQKIGFKWLKILNNYRFGGILADDMGLGKTIQMLTIILDYIQNEKEKRRATLVVSPSSLTLNWLSEARRFAPNLKVGVIKGTSIERRKLISNIDDFDLIITSYDLLKRDIKVYTEKNYNFKFIIADEAQYLKNSTTQNAKAIKQLNSDTRYALTGTPIENSLSELWSIFDFIMPGYLFSYRQFKSLYETPIVKEEDKKAMDKLKMLIQPFILRRTKKEVLTELPEKTITVLNNQMQDEQQAIYMSYLAQIKEEVANEININGFEKSQIKILAALTRLRQICCHPSLFISDYAGESSKLLQCMEIITDAISAGHKILLFSGYTAMFEIIEKELKDREVKYFKLTGSTKVDERMSLVDEFNKNPDVKIFLISLKAGGTGLNLTGADMVIHYDPWWNQSAENQATDRAYRIGQKNNVQVYKLITSNSIEEKIYELQQKKSELIDNMLDTKTEFINKFTKDEIMNLFE
ncbi:MAG: DEAD/DEAH box helicase [Clostridia bacterium]|nr:DEAD/DEAH box helicase [Clostridia bacterium]